MAKRTIEFQLSREGIDWAISQLETFQKDFQSRCDQVLVEAEETGVTVGKEQIQRLRKIGWTRGLISSMFGTFNRESRVAKVINNSDHAAYVEYGTGVKGDHGRHPNPPAGWTYDRNGHGDAGWKYYNPMDDKFHKTRGEPAAPFMWFTFQELKRKVPEIVHKVFNGM